MQERQRMDAMIADPWRQQFRANNPRMQYDPAAESAKSTAALNAYDDPVRRNLAAGTRALGIPDFTGHNMIAAAEFLPGVGDALDAQDSALAFGKGDYLTGGLLGGAAAIGLVPGVGDALGGAIGGMVKGTGKAADALTDARKGIRVYHGGSGALPDAALDRGAWFSEARELADEYAQNGGKVIEASISPHRTLSFRHAEQQRTIGDVISTALEGAGDIDDSTAASVRGIVDKLYSKYGDSQRPLFEYWNKDKDVTDLFRKLGYDSVSVAEKPDMSAATWGMLDPSKIETAAPKGIRAYHGSPHDFDQFDISKIGTGEGAQAYGHGLYFAGDQSVANSYRSSVSAQKGSSATIDGRKIDWDNPKEYAAFELWRHNGDADAAAEFAERMFGNKPAADMLRAGESLPEVKPPGHMYEVNINADPEDFLDWDKPLSQQPESVRQRLQALGHDTERKEAAFIEQTKGGRFTVRDNLSEKVSGTFRTREAAQARVDELTAQNPRFSRGAGQELEFNPIMSRGKYGGDPGEEVQKFSQAGIPGIKYLDQGSRAAGEGSRNYVVFDDKLVSLIRKYGLAALLAGGGMGAWGMAPEGGEPPPL